jgi:hypothetical protein
VNRVYATGVNIMCGSKNGRSYAPKNECYFPTNGFRNGT